MHIDGLETKDGVDAAYEYLNKRNVEKRDLGWMIASVTMFFLGLIGGAFAMLI